jgi:TRAP-type uncharacterized transport system fused permease subunit
MVEQNCRPALSAFWATLFIIFVMLTQKPIQALFRGAGGLGAATRSGAMDLIDGLAAGARNMIGIGVATAARASSWGQFLSPASAW